MTASSGGHALMTVSNWLGHARVSTTERYADQIEAMQDEERSETRMDERRAHRAARAGSTR